MPTSVFDDLIPAKTGTFDDLIPSSPFDDLVPPVKGAFDDLPEADRSGLAAENLDFFNRTHPELSPLQGPATTHTDSLAPALPQSPVGPTPSFIGAQPEQKPVQSIEDLLSQTGEPIAEPPGQYRAEHPQTPAEVFQMPTKMPTPKLDEATAGALLRGMYPEGDTADTLAPYLAGSQQSLGNFVDFLTAPGGIATTLIGGPIGEGVAMGKAGFQAAGQIGEAGSRAMATSFALDMSRNLPDQFDAINDALSRGDRTAAIRETLNGAAALWMIGHAAKSHLTENALKPAQSDSGGIEPPAPTQGLPPTAPATPAPAIDPTEDFVKQLEDRIKSNQILKTEKPPETPGNVIEKALEAEPLKPNEPQSSSSPISNRETSEVNPFANLPEAAAPVRATEPQAEADSGGKEVLPVRPEASLTPEEQEAVQRQLSEETGEIAPRGTIDTPPPAPEGGKPDPDWKVTVQAPEYEDGRMASPGYVQIDDVSGGKNNWSSGPDNLRKLGYEMPDFTDVPSGKYKLGDLTENPQRALTAPGGKVGSADKPILTEATRRQNTIYLSFDMTSRVPTAKELTSMFKAGGHDVEFVEFEPNVISTTEGTIKFRGDAADAQGRYSDEVAKQAYRQNFGQDQDIRSQSAVSRAIPFQERFWRSLKEYSRRESGISEQEPPSTRPGVMPEANAGTRETLPATTGETVPTESAKPTGGKPEIEQPIEERGGRGGNLSTFGLFDPANYKASFEALSDEGRALFGWSLKQRKRVVYRFKRSDQRDFVSATKDAADTRANLSGKRGGNIILHELNRAFADKVDIRNPLREMALTMAVEAGGDRANLGEMRYRLTSAEAEGVNRTWKRRALAAIDFADENWDKLQPVADQYKRLTDAENSYENANGIRTLYRQGGYVFHVQDVDESFGVPSTGNAQDIGGSPAPFRHIRDHQTYADAIAAGVTPLSLNAVDLLQKRIGLGQRLVNYGDWVDAMRGINDPVTQQPMVAAPTIRARADGTEDVTAPPGYSLVNFANRQLALHKGYTGLFGDLTNPSWMQGTDFRKGLMSTLSTMKHGSLLFDTYHMVRMGFWNSMTRLGLPTSSRGLSLLDNTLPELRRMVDRGEIPNEWGEQLLQQKSKLEGLVKAGLNVGSIGDNLYTDFLQKIPGLGTFNKWLFEKYQRGIMAECALIEHDRQRSMFPNDTPQQLSRRVAKDINTRFGNLQSQSWIKSRTGQDLARVIFLAPQWNESLIRSELGAVRQLVASPIQSYKAGRPAMGGLARGVGAAMLATFIGNQLLNMAFRGKPTWENEEEEPGAKISGYIPDFVGHGPGFFLNPLSVPMEISNLLWRSADRHGGDLTLALRDSAAGRFSGLSKGLWTFMTGNTPMGQPTKGGWDRVGQSIAQAAPIPISSGAAYRGVKQLVTGNNQEKFPGQVQMQMMQSVGVKTEPVPDASRRVYDLASKFKRNRGIVEAPTHDIPVYGELTSAVKTGNMDDAREALAKILTMAKGNGDPHTVEDVRRYYTQYPNRTFTGNRGMEEAFKRTLTPAQLGVYNRAVADRAQIAAKVQALLR